MSDDPAALFGADPDDAAVPFGEEPTVGLFGRPSDAPEPDAPSSLFAEPPAEEIDALFPDTVLPKTGRKLPMRQSDAHPPADPEPLQVDPFTFGAPLAVLPAPEAADPAASDHEPETPPRPAPNHYVPGFVRQPEPAAPTQFFVPQAAPPTPPSRANTQPDARIAAVQRSPPTYVPGIAPKKEAPAPTIFSPTPSTSVPAAPPPPVASYARPPPVPAAGPVAVPGFARPKQETPTIFTPPTAVLPTGAVPSVTAPPPLQRPPDFAAVPRPAGAVYAPPPLPQAPAQVFSLPSFAAGQQVHPPRTPDVPHVSGFAFADIQRPPVVSRPIPRSETTDQISDWQTLTPEGSRPVPHSTSQPSDVRQSSLPFFSRRRPVNLLGFGGIVIRSRPRARVAVESLSDMRSVRVVRQLDEYMLQKESDMGTFIGARIDDCESAPDALLWSTVRVRRGYFAKQPDAATHEFNERVRTPGTPEQHLLSLLAVPREDVQAPVRYSSTAPQAGQVEALQSILLDQGAKSALEYAIDNCLWPFAFILARAVGPGEFDRVSLLFVSSTLAPSPLANVLNVLSGNRAEISMRNWQSVLALTVRHFSVNSIATLQAMAEHLEQNGDLKSAHLCRLLAFQHLRPPPGPFSLVGADWKHPTISSIQMSQLASEKLADLPLQYILWYTMALIDFGFTQRAHDNVRRMFSLWSSGRLFSVCQMLFNRLQRIGAQKSGFVKTTITTIHNAVTSFVTGRGDQAHDDYQHSKLPASVSVEYPEPPPVPQPQMLVPASPPQDEKKEEPKQQGWLGGLLSKLNPFKRPAGINLEEHDNEMYWNGSRYVVRGHENDPPEPPPPPPPRSRSYSAPEPQAAPQFGAQQQQQQVASFGAQQQQAAPFGAQQQQAAPFGAQQQQAASFGAQQQQAASFGAQQQQAASFGAQQQQAASFGAQQQQQQAAPFGAQQSDVLPVDAPAPPFGAPPPPAGPGPGGPASRSRTAGRYVSTF